MPKYDLDQLQLQLVAGAAVLSFVPSQLSHDYPLLVHAEGQGAQEPHSSPEPHEEGGAVLPTGAACRRAALCKCPALGREEADGGKGEQTARETNQDSPRSREGLDTCAPRTKPLVGGRGRLVTLGGREKVPPPFPFAEPGPG